MHQQKYYLPRMSPRCVLTSAKSFLHPVRPVHPESRCDLLGLGLGHERAKRASGKGTTV